MTTRVSTSSTGVGSGVREGVASRLEEALGRSCAATCRSGCGRGTAREAGPADAPLVVLRSPDAVRRMVWRPGELGAAQAYVTGELDVPGDLGAALTHAFEVGRERGLSGVRPTPAALRPGGPGRGRDRCPRPPAGCAGHPGPGPWPAAQPAA